MVLRILGEIIEGPRRRRANQNHRMRASLLEREGLKSEDLFESVEIWK